MVFDVGKETNMVFTFGRIPSRDTTVFWNIDLASASAAFRSAIDLCTAAEK